MEKPKKGDIFKSQNHIYQFNGAEWEYIKENSGAQISFRLPSTLKQKIQDLANKENQPISRILNDLIRKRLNEK